jgi:diguanylate cyclase (GGDEF)-like protein
MIKKINAALIALAVSLAFYIAMRQELPLISYAYLIMLFGLYFAKWSKEAVLICAAVSFFCALNFMNQSRTAAILSCVLFLCCAAVPYYFLMKTERKKKESLKINLDMQNKLDKTISLHSKVLFGRKKYEDKFERIMQFYISTRELAKSASISDVIDVICKSFKSMSGSVGLNIFGFYRGKWECLYCDSPSLGEQWLKYLSDYGDAEEMKLTFEMDNPDFIPKTQSVIFLPVRMQNEVMGCILLICQKNYTARYILGGQIFSSQTSLSVKRIRLMNEVESKARNDGLTGLYRRNHFMERLQNEIEMEKRYPKGFFIMMLDIDWFKKVNDRFGHLTGDRVLVSVAKILSDTSSFGAFAGRYGGEEFVIFVPVSKENEAIAIAEAVKKSAAAKRYKNGKETFGISVSIGLSAFPRDGITPEELINAADKALYKAKERGRNRVEVYKDRKVKQ